MTKTLPGTLILAANSIGCEEDIPLRAKSLLKSVDLVIFEEDKLARKTLKAAGIIRDYLKFNEHAQEATEEELTQALKSGKKVLYMSDQGCPNLDDPATPLLKIAFKLKCKIEVIPGPSSLTGAISACPIPLKQFIYVGFLPKSPGDREKELKKYLSIKLPLVILDTPYRLVHLVESIKKVTLGKGNLFIAFDIGNKAQSYHNFELNQMDLKLLQEHKDQNFVLVVFPR